MQALGIYLRAAGVVQVHQYLFNYLPTTRKQVKE